MYMYQENKILLQSNKGKNNWNG